MIRGLYTARVREKILRWLAWSRAPAGAQWACIAIGVLCLAGAGISLAAQFLFLGHGDQRADWPLVQGRLRSIAISAVPRIYSRTTYSYLVEVECTYEVGRLRLVTRNFPGPAASSSLPGMQAFLANYAPEAAQLTAGDFSGERPIHKFRPASVDVGVRHRPGTPQESECMLENPLPRSRMALWALAFALGLILFGVACGVVRAYARRRSSPG